MSLGLRLQQIHSEEPDLPAVRVGIHLGEVTERPAPVGSSKPTLVEGLAVDLASRIMSLALPGQVLMSSAVFDAARQRQRPEVVGQKVSWLTHGPYRFKGVDEPIEIAEAGLGNIFSFTAPPDSEKAWRLAKSGNLPSLLPAFVGRDRELASLLEVVGSRRLVTVVGPAGSGKTRTAIQAAREMASAFQGGVWLVELGQEGEPHEVAAAVARTLAVAPEPGVDLLDALVDTLRYRPALLVLDNCDRVIATAADLAERLLEACTELRVLATSREPLRSRVEHVFPLGPMSIGSADGGLSDAVALFIDRARSEGATEQQLREDRAPIEELCARLDGLPLAIELAAARTRSIDTRQLVTLLDERFRVLKAGRSADVRHQTLRSAIDWSYDLLEEQERVLFDTLSLFAGPFELADAVAVICDAESDEIDILDRLSALVDRSMVMAVPGRLPSYRLLETLRAYGAQCLAARDGVENLRRRHAEHFAVKATAARGEIVGPRHVAVIDQLVVQAAEYRTATAWARGVGDIDLAVRLAAGFCGASYFRIGYEALDWLGPTPETAAKPERPPSVELLGLLARRAVFSGDIEVGRKLAERAIAMDPGPRSVQARAQMALILMAKGDAAMLDWAQSAVDLAEPAGDHLGVLLGRLVTGPMLARMGRVEESLAVGRSLLSLGDEQDSEHARGWGHLVLGVALSHTDPENSKEHLSTAIRLGRAEKNRYLQSNALIAELEAHLANDSPAAAATAARETLIQMQEGADNGLFTRRVLSQIAMFLAAQSRPEACQLDGYVGSFADSARHTRAAHARVAALQRLAGELGEETAERLRAAGGRLGADDAIVVAVAALDEVAAD